MNYKLIEITPNGNQDQYGGKDEEVELAISDSIEHLEHYCNNILKKQFNKPQVFNWKSYCVIRETNIKII